MKHRGRRTDADLLRLRELVARGNARASEALVEADIALDSGAQPRHRQAYRDALAEAQVDESAATELDLFAENSGELYPQFKSIIDNLKKKIVRGTYDPSRAWKLWMYWYNAAVARYTLEFATSHHPFSTALRRVLAKRRAVDEHAKILAEEYGPLSPYYVMRKHRGHP